MVREVMDRFIAVSILLMGCYEKSCLINGDMIMNRKPIEKVETNDRIMEDKIIDIEVRICYARAAQKFARKKMQELNNEG